MCLDSNQSPASFDDSRATNERLELGERDAHASCTSRERDSRGIGAPQTKLDIL